jgi:hypothetical protein
MKYTRGTSALDWGNKEDHEQKQRGGLFQTQNSNTGKDNKQKKKQKDREEGSEEEKKKQRSSSRPGKPFFFSTRFIAQFIRHSSFPLHYNSLPTIAVNYNSVVHVASVRCHARLLLGRFTVAWAVTGQPKRKEKKKLKTVEIGPGWAQAHPTQFILGQECFRKKNTLILIPFILFSFVLIFSQTNFFVISEYSQKICEPF